MKLDPTGPGTVARRFHRGFINADYMCPKHVKVMMV